MTLDHQRFENGPWLDSIDAEEAERLRQRLQTLRNAMGNVRAAASGEEPLFPPEIAAPFVEDEDEEER